MHPYEFDYPIDPRDNAAKLIYSSAPKPPPINSGMIADARAHCRLPPLIEGQSESNEFIAKVAAAGSMVQAYIQRPLFIQPFTAMWEGNAPPRLPLPVRPAKMGDNTILEKRNFGGEWAAVSEGYEIIGDALYINFIRMSLRFQTAQFWRLQNYQAGMFAEGETEDEKWTNIPEAIKMGIWQTTAYLWTGRGDDKEAAQTIGGLPAIAAAVVHAYKGY